MSDQKLLTVRDVAVMLSLNEKEVLDLAEQGLIPAYKVGGVYLRFKRSQVEEFKHSHKKMIGSPAAYSAFDRIIDFWYFNDFYIIALVAMLVLVYIIFQ